MSEELKEDDAKALIEKKLSSQAFRLANLYWVEDENGRKVKFRPRWEQRELHNRLHNQNVVLKCRQPGISTYCALLELDFSLFTAHKTCGIIDKTDEDAKRKLDKIRFAYDHLDDPDTQNLNGSEDTSRLGSMVKSAVTLTVNNVKELEFSNGSKIWSGTKMRGGTLQFLWITELGFTSFYNPDHAEEIKKGALNTVHKDAIVIVESTHEGGKFGVFYSLLKLAMEAPDVLSPMDWKFTFFPWWRCVNYSLPLPAPLPLEKEDQHYFERLAARGIVLTDGQKNWYIKKRTTIGDAMLSEFPSTPEEAFEAVIKGAIYGREISKLRASRRITDFEWDRVAPMYASWDLGFSDYTAIWLLQPAGRDILAIDYVCGCREGPEYYAARIREWEAKYDRPITLHFLPHDADAKEKSGKSYRDYLRDAGISNVRVVVRSPDQWIGIRRLRSLLPRFYFHAKNCGREWQHDGRAMPSGIGCLEGYHTKEDASSGVIREMPVHDENSHGADSLRTFAEAEMLGLVPKETLQHMPGDNVPKPKVILAGWNRSREEILRRLR